MVSAVPAGEVMAREDVFGMVRPQAATMATTIGVVRLPGRPPTQCLSTIGRAVPGQGGRPTSTMARVSADHLVAVERAAAQAVMKAASWMSE